MKHVERCLHTASMPYTLAALVSLDVKCHYGTETESVSERQGLHLPGAPELTTGLLMTSSRGFSGQQETFCPSARPCELCLVQA